MERRQPRQPNRAERRRMMKSQPKKKHKSLMENSPNIFISCPDCKSRDVVRTRKDAGKEYFTCNKCGRSHELSEMGVEL